MTDAQALLDRTRWPDLAARLAVWLPSRRWFQGKARRIADAAIDDVALLPGRPPVADVLLSIAYDRGADERYQIPLTAGGPPDPDLGPVDGLLPLADALGSVDGARTLAGHLLSAASRGSAGGARVVGVPVGDPPELPPAGRPLGAEQSNSSFVLGDTLLLKVFRKLEAGLNPEVELTRALTEEGFDHVPPQAGALVLEAGAEPTALAILTAFRAGSRDAWELALDEADAARSEPPPPLEGRAADLGRVVAALHLALRRRFGGRDAGRGDVEAWADALLSQLEEVRALARAGSGAAAALDEHAAAIRARVERFRRLDDAGAVIRIHGDLHLGQVLLDAEHGWQILDFEGEPARSLADRRRPHSPARDVAGMLRSFDYAAAHDDAGDPPPGVARWRDEGRRAFLAAYVERAGAEGLLPRDGAAQRVLLDAFELEKAVYEVGYELANRPAWVGIPLAGILRLVEHGSVPSAIER